MPSTQLDNQIESNSVAETAPTRDQIDPSKITIQDVVSRWRAGLRRIRPFRVIAHPSLRGPYTHDQFVEATTSVHEQGMKAKSLLEKTRAFWQMEKLGFSYCRHEDGNLNSGSIPSLVQPISHVGLGIGATESAQFQADRLAELIEPRAHPAYRLFPYESIGCLWAVFASKWFRRVFAIFARQSIPATKLPSLDVFLAALPPEIQPLIAHGYGRTLYFKYYNIGRAIREAIKLQDLDTKVTVQGIAFAYCMINCSDLPKILTAGQDIEHPTLATGFRDGQVYALTFWEWAFPGFLDSLHIDSNRMQELVDTSRQQVAESRDAGALCVFGVSQ